MDFLKKLFPMSFACTGDVSTIVKTVIIYIVADILVGLAVSLIGLAGIEILSILVGAVVINSATDLSWNFANNLASHIVGIKLVTAMFYHSLFF